MRKLLVLQQMKRSTRINPRAAFWAVVIVVAPTLLTPAAAAQNPSARLAPESPEVLESAGEVVLTVSMWRAGRLEYRTFDGSCAVNFGRAGGVPGATCSNDKKARAPDDYTAASGELVFTGGGSKTITIPIVDDGVAEGDEAFTVAAWEEANADPWLDRGDSVIVSIKDHEGDTSGRNSAAAAPRSSTNSKPAGGQPSGSAVSAPAPGTAASATPTTEPESAPEFPQPDVAVRGDGAPESAQDREGRGATSGLAIIIGVAALGVGALALRRR